MATFLLSNTLTPLLSPTTPRASLRQSLAYPPPLVSFSPHRRNNRAVRVVTRAGPPSTTTYIMAFVFPLSLLGFTILTSIRIADKLDEKYLQELEINEAIRAADEEDEEEDDDDNVAAEKEVLPDAPPPRSRSRNRPKKELIDSL